MSNVNIKRLVENIRSNTSIYTPIVEILVNAIQAIETNETSKGKINITVYRSEQQNLNDSLRSIQGFSIEDNGVGFTDKNRNSFDTLYSDHKIEMGGKGFGRFTALKYFDNMLVESVFAFSGKHKKRTFKMGRSNEIIINEKIEECAENETGSIIFLKGIKDRNFPDKKLKTIARTLVEKLLPYFIDAEYKCPEITISEEDRSETIALNNFIHNQLSAMISEIKLDNNNIKLGSGEKVQDFKVRVFKIFSPSSQKSKISLVADRREVTATAIHNYVPEFADEFYEEIKIDGSSQDRNYITKAYVFGLYLDSNVSLERGGFEFSKEDDLLYSISQREIEEAAANIAKSALGDKITTRQEKKAKQVQDYIENSAPWHRTIVEEVDLSLMPYNPTAEQIETVFQKEKFGQETAIRKEIEEILSNPKSEDTENSLTEILDKISKTSRSDLIHYIALRKHVLSLFKKSFEFTNEGKYPSEGTVHDIIFPRKGDAKTTSFHDHNLWMIDERLNFTNFVHSDQPLSGKNTERPDILVFDRPVLFRGDNEESNPITIFEFKRPGRDDFVNPSSKEDPIQQIIRYVNNIKKGRIKTQEGRPVRFSDNTPCYGYVMCETSEKVKEWLRLEKDFKPMPDGLGWFKWIDNINLYIEVLSWDKVLQDAEMRNGIFFHKLGI